MREYEHQAKHDFHQEFVSGKVVDVTVATDVDYDIYNRDEIEDVTLEFIVSYTLTGESLERKQRSWDNWKEVQRRVQAKKDADKAEMYAEIEAKAQRDEAKIEEKAYELFLQMKKKYEDVEEPTFFKKDE
jgi:sialic acid synthase SpsE